MPQRDKIRVIDDSIAKLVCLLKNLNSFVKSSVERKLKINTWAEKLYAGQKAN